MADTKLSSLAALAAADTDDLLYIVDVSAGVAGSKKITKANFLGVDLTLSKGQITLQAGNGTSGDSVLCGSEANVITAASPMNVISGGGSAAAPNQIISGANICVISGGYDNTITGDATKQANTISGGAHNVITDADHALIAGGSTCTITGTTTGNSYASILGGRNHDIGDGANFSIVAGGDNNDVTGTNSAIVGGLNQTITTSNYAGIFGGSGNTITSGSLSAILGGITCTASGTRSTVIGGSNCVASGDQSIVIAGANSTASGAPSTIMNGYASVASGSGSVVIGRAGTASNTGSMVITDYDGTAVTNAVANSLVMSFVGGIQIQNKAADEIGFFGATPVNQPNFIADPSGGATTDAEARTAINAILDLLIELGLMASA